MTTDSSLIGTELVGQLAAWRNGPHGNAGSTPSYAGSTPSYDGARVGVPSHTRSGDGVDLPFGRTIPQPSHPYF